MKDFFVGSFMFDLPHFILLGIFTIAIVLLVVFTKLFAKKENQVNWVIKGTAIFLLVLVIFSRFVYNNFTPTFLDFLPNTFCSTMGFLMPIFVLCCKKDSKLLYYAIFAGLIGGVLTIIFADFIGQEQIFNTMVSYSYHSVMVGLAVLCFATKYCTPTLNKVPTLAMGLSFMMVYGIFSNQVFKYSNNMFINSDLISGISWWLCGILIFVIAITTALIFEAFTRKWHDQNLFKIYNTISVKTKNLFKKNK